MQTKKIQIKGENIEKLHEMIIEKWAPSYIYQNDNCFVYMNEQQYYRIKSNLLSVLIVKFVEKYECEIEIVTGGGSTEMDYDWGAENKQNESIIKELIEISESNSWIINGISPDEFNKYKRKNILDKVVEFLEK